MHRGGGWVGACPTWIIRKKRHEQRGKKAQRLLPLLPLRRRRRRGERVHVDIQFSSDQKVEENGGAGLSPTTTHPSPRPSSVRGFWLVENKVSRRIAEEIYGAISRPAWHSTIRINTFFRPSTPPIPPPPFTFLFALYVYIVYNVMCMYVYVRVYIYV